jgi:hypothetical protein
MSNSKKSKKSHLPVGIAFMVVGAVFMTSINPGVGIGLIGVGLVFIIIGAGKAESNDAPNEGKRDENDI